MIGGERGQALVEVLWLAPVAASIVAGVIAAGAWLSGSSTAAHAAHAAAVGLLEGNDPVEAAKRTAAGWQTVSVPEHGPSEIRVQVEPSGIPGFLRGTLRSEAKLSLGTSAR